MTTALTAVGLSPQVVAQEAEQAVDGDMEVIVVTTRRKQESLDEIPLAVSAFGERQFEDLNVLNLRDLGKYVPNLHIGNFGNGNPAHTSVFLRGVGQQDHIITVDSGVGIYLDGVYLGRQIGSNLNMANIERVEVARGPQGTLYGRNNIGGAINFISKKPTGQDEVTVSLQGGSRERVKVDFHAATALTDTLFFSMTGQYNRRGGVGEFLNQPNTDLEVGQIREGSARAALNWAPTDDFSLILTADLTDGSYGHPPIFFVTDDPTIGPNGLPREAFAEDPFDTASPADNVAGQTSLAYGFSATAEYAFNDVFATKFIGSYRSSEYNGGSDQQDEFGSVVFPEEGQADQFSLETQLTGSFDRWDFIVGAYLFNEDGTVLSAPFEIFPGAFTDSGIIDVRQQTESYALFGSASVQLTDRLEISGGVRHTWDEKNGVAGVTFFPPNALTERRETWTATTWDASVLYNLTDAVNVYALASRGYQSGGFPARPFGGPDEFV
ncbi:MAG: TonB-dependent receptor, partial [Pseudomonadota bacterium]